MSYYRFVYGGRYESEGLLTFAWGIQQYPNSKGLKNLKFNLNKINEVMRWYNSYLPAPSTKFYRSTNTDNHYYWFKDTAIESIAKGKELMNAINGTALFEAEEVNSILYEDKFQVLASLSRRNKVYRVD